jgi:hypothetical protein
MNRGYNRDIIEICWDKMGWISIYIYNDYIIYDILKSNIFVRMLCGNVTQFNVFFRHTCDSGMSENGGLNMIEPPRNGPFKSGEL